MLSGNAAIALGIMGRRECLPRLRELVRARDCFYFLDCRRSNQFRSAIAICLLGRLGDTSDLDLLRGIVFEDGEFDSYEQILYPLPENDKKNMQTTTETVLEAHQTLMDADSSNQQRFQAVVDMTQQDLDRMKGNK